MEAEARPTDTDWTSGKAQRDRIWFGTTKRPASASAVHGNGEKSFIFVYRRDKRQRFVRIGTTPTWSLEGARRWPKELRSAVDRGDEPET